MERHGWPGIILISIIVFSGCGAVSRNEYPPVGHWYSKDSHLSFNIDEEKLLAYHGTYEIDGEIMESVVFANGIDGSLEIYDVSVYNFDTGGFNTTLDGTLYKGTYKLKDGDLHFKLSYRNDGIEKLETIIMKNIAEE